MNSEATQPDRALNKGIGELHWSPSVFLRRWCRIVERRSTVIDVHRRAIFELHLATGDQQVAFLDAGEDGDLIATVGPVLIKVCCAVSTSSPLSFLLDNF